MMEQRTIRPAPVRKSVTVAADLEKAFAVFTSGMGRWWPASHSVGDSPLRDVVIEPATGGRWFGRLEDGSEAEWGKVLAWEPPKRVLFAWQLNGNWTYDADFQTEVEVTFTPVGPRETRVDLEHRNLERYGDALEKTRGALDSEGGWSGLLALYAGAAGR